MRHTRAAMPAKAQSIDLSQVAATRALLSSALLVSVIVLLGLLGRTGWLLTT